MSPELRFCFKGSRNYVHGTDIVASLLKQFPNGLITDLDVKFNGVVLTNLVMTEGTEQTNAKVNVRLLIDGLPKVLKLTENAQEINCRYDYDEDKIITDCHLDIESQHIKQKSLTSYTLCENFVAMNKALLQALFPDEDGKWYFTRLEQKRIVPNDTLITVKLIKNFNFRLTKSDILIGDEVIGSVYFTMVRG